MADVAELGLKVTGVDSVERAATATDKLSKSAEKTEKSIQKMGVSTDKTTASIKKATAETNALDASMSKLAGAAKLAAGAFAGIQLGSLVKDITMANSRFEQLGLVMGVVGRNANLSQKQVNAYAKEVEAMGISMTEARQTVISMASAQMDMTKASQLARLAQDAAVIANTNSSDALGRLISGLQTGNTLVLRNMGLNVNLTKSYEALADQIGVNADQLTEAQKIQARTNAVMEAGIGIAGAYEASMENAGKQLGSTTRYLQDLGVMWGEVFSEAARGAISGYSDALKWAHATTKQMSEDGTLSRLAEAIGSLARGLVTAAKVAGTFAIAMYAIPAITKAAKGAVLLLNAALRASPLGIAASLAAAAAVAFFDMGDNAQKAAGGVDEMARAVDRVRAAEKRLTDIRKTRARWYGWLVYNQKDEDFAEAEVESAHEQAARTGKNVFSDAAGEIKKNTTPAVKEATEAIEKLSKASKTAVNEGKRFVEALKQEAAELGKTRHEVLRMEAARLGVSKAADKYIFQLEQEAEREEWLSQARAQHSKWLQENRQLTEAAKTQQEQWSEQLKDLKSRLEQGGISLETYNRLVGGIQNKMWEAEEASRSGFDAMAEYAKQAARNIQTALADWLFNPFDKGLKGMVKSFANALRRMAAEVAASKILQAVGFGGILGLGSGAAMASGGASGGGVGMMDLASLGSSAYNIISNGFGAVSGIGSIISSAGSAFGSSAVNAFGAGMSTAGGEAGASGAQYVAMLKNPGAAQMGAKMGQAIGTIGAGLAGVMGGSLLAGDKKLFGLGGSMTSGAGALVGSYFGPVGAFAGGLIGGGLNALFGRGPYKQKETTMSTTVTPDGLLGETSTRFKSKGGLLVSNKNKYDIQPLQGAFRELIEDSVEGFRFVLKDVARNFDLDQTLIDEFTREFKMESPKGEWFTDEQIVGLITEIGDAMALELMPSLVDFQKGTETAIQTLTRLNSDFSTLADAALILGVSLEESREIVKQTSIENRSAFIKSAGGMEALAEKAAFFAANFMDDAERLQPSIELLDEQMAAIGLSADITKDDFKGLVQSFGQVGGITEEMLISLLNVAPLFVQVKDGLAELHPELHAAEDATVALSDAMSEITKRKNELSASYRREHDELLRMSDRFMTIAQGLRSASDALSLGDLSPLTPGQKLEEARAQFMRDRQLAAAGDEDAMARLAESGRELLKASQVFNASSSEYVADFNFVQQTLAEFAKSAEKESNYAKEQADALTASISHLIDIDESVISVADAIKSLEDAMIAALKLSSNKGNAAVTDKEILDYFSAPRTVSETRQAALDNNISSSQIAKATGVDVGYINDTIFSDAAKNNNSIVTAPPKISDKDIADFVASGKSVQEIYRAAIDNGIDSRRLANALGMSQSEILKIASENGLPSFASGTDYVKSDGLAYLHKAEAVTPAGHMKTMADEIKSLKSTVSSLLSELNARTGELVGAVIASGKETAQTIVEGQEQQSRQGAWLNNSRAYIK